MKALVWHGKGNVQIDNVPDPTIQEPGDIIVKVTRTAICGSDLHILDGYVPAMEKGDILGHEFMGEVVDLGSEVTKFKKGDRVVVPFVIACGHCEFCKRQEVSFCDNSNPDAEKVEKLQGHAGSAMFGYSHMYGGFDGGQAEYVRVPYADAGPIKIPGGIEDEKVLFLSDIFPTGWMAAENAHIQKGDTVAIWGCGPVGLMAIKSAWLMGAGRVIAIDHVPERLAMAEKDGPAEVIDFMKQDVYETLQSMTKGRGPDSCIDAVGTENHGLGSVDAVMDRAKNMVGLATDQLHSLREAIHCCRKGGSISVPGVYMGFVDKFPLGTAFGKGLKLTGGQTHVQRYLPDLLKLVEAGKIDPSFIITHRLKLEEAPEAYKTFRDKKDNCIKVVMTP